MLEIGVVFTGELTDRLVYLIDENYSSEVVSMYSLSDTTFTIILKNCCSKYSSSPTISSISFRYFSSWELCLLYCFSRLFNYKYLSESLSYHNSSKKISHFLSNLKYLCFIIFNWFIIFFKYILKNMKEFWLGLLEFWDCLDSFLILLNFQILNIL